MVKAQAHKNLNMIVLVTCISFIGMALPYPMLAPLFFSEPLYFNPHEMIFSPEIMYGLSLAAYPFAQFFGSIYLGRLSDTFGRKKILQISILGASLGFLLSSLTLYSHSLNLFILSRLITGLFEGQIAIARAIATDLSPQIEKSKSFSSINAAATAGYLIGPIIGGLLSDDKVFSFSSPTIPFIVAAFLSLTSFFLVKRYLKDAELQKELPDIKLTYQFKPLRKIMILIIASFFVTLSFDVLYQFSPAYLVEKWKFDEFDIALATTFLSLFMIISQVFIIPKVKEGKYFNIMILSSIVFAITLSFMAFLTSLWPVYICLPFMGLCIGIAGTYVPVYVSDHVSHHKQGRLMGILMGSRSLGDAAICLLGSFTLTISPSFPLFIGCFSISIGIITLLSSRKFMKQYEIKKT